MDPSRLNCGRMKYIGSRGPVCPRPFRADIQSMSPAGDVQFKNGCHLFGSQHDIHLFAEAAYRRWADFLKVSCVIFGDF